MPSISGIPFLVRSSMKWANQGSAELDYICVLSRGFMRRQYLDRGGSRGLTHLVAELVGCAVEREDKGAHFITR